MNIRNLRPTALAFILLLAAVAPLAGCRREEPRTAPQAEAGKCPKIDGSYFGADKADATKGEPITLSWKVPPAYQKTVDVEGLDKSTSITTQAYSEADPPQLLETSVAGVTPEKSTRFVLKAPGPQGCEPVELAATVYVIEPEENGRAGDTGAACMNARQVQFWTAPQAEDKNLVRLVWFAPGARRAVVDGHGTDVTQGSMLVDLRWRKQDGTDREGQPRYNFSFTAEKGGCRPVEVKKTFTQDR